MPSIIYNFFVFYANRKILAKIKSGELDVDQVSSTTAQDQEDQWSLELASFTPAPRITGKK